MDHSNVERLEAFNASEALLKIFDMQVRRDMDYVRAREYWNRCIQDLPIGTLVEALARLSSGRYQMTPRYQCQCCRHC
jgi:hypothetical protein